MTVSLPGVRSSGSRRLGGLCVVVAVVLVFIAEGLSWVRWSSVWPSGGIPVEMVLATGADKWNRAARESLDAWNQAGSNFRFTSTTSSASERASCSAAGVDRRNVVIFASTVCGDSWSSEAVAITRVWYSTADNLTVDADVFFNAERDWGAPRVRVGLSSREPASLYLLRGEAVDGNLVTSASGADPRIVQTLSSGTYTVEVLPARAGVTAAFVLRVGAREPFVDDPLRAGDPIRAAHLTEMRERIDALRGTAGLGPFRWTDPTIVPGVTPIRAVHVTELHTALNEVYLEDGRSRPSRAGDVREGVPIAADHFNAIRRAIEDL